MIDVPVHNTAGNKANVSIAKSAAPAATCFGSAISELSS